MIRSLLEKSTEEQDLIEKSNKKVKTTEGMYVETSNEAINEEMEGKGSYKDKQVGQVRMIQQWRMQVSLRLSILRKNLNRRMKTMMNAR